VLVEAGGRRLFYSGDLRAHGRKAGLFEELIREPPAAVDVILMEGTHIRADMNGEERGASESDVEDACAESFRGAPGIVLAMFSPQNIDRLVTMYRACLRSGRTLVIDLYGAAVAKATGRNTIPQAEWNRVRVYLPRSQKSKVIREQAFDRTKGVRADRIYPEELLARRKDLVMLFRASMASELEHCLEGARIVWSMWPGYLHEPSGERLRSWADRLAIPIAIHHASGHAFVSDLKRLVDAINPRRVVPIHSEAGDRFAEFFPRVELRADAEWWVI
jgi:ribonuclease J